MKSLPGWTRRNLELQGFAPHLDERMALARGWLRFTPAASAALLATATVLRSPALFWSFGAIAVVGAAGVHGFDLLFNRVIGPLIRAARLPPSPAPRRFSMLLGGLLGLLAGTSMAAGAMVAGTVLGGLLTLAALVSVLSHFCAGSWIFHQLGFDRPGTSSSCSV